MARNLFSFLSIVSFFVFLQASCGEGFRSAGSGDGSSIAPTVLSWDFTTPANYTFDSTKVAITGGEATILTQDYLIDTLAEFTAGTFAGTQYGVGALTLDPATALNLLNSSNAPQFGLIVGYWDFEGDFNDSSVEGNTAVANGDAVTDPIVYKAGGESLLLDGAGDYLTVVDDDSLDNDLVDQLSVSMWYKFDASGSIETLLSKGCYTGAGWSELSYSVHKNIANNLVFTISTDGTTALSISSLSTLRPSQWYNVAVVYDGTVIHIYIDGNLDSSVAASGVIYNGTSSLYIGGRESGGTCLAVDQELSGHLDDVAMWKQGLTVSELQQIFKVQSQKYYGYFDSAIIDSGSPTSPWPKLGWTTNLPYYKEYTGDYDGSGAPNSESSSQYVNLVGVNGSTTDNNNMSQLIMLLRLNKATGAFTGLAGEMQDSSGLGNDGNASGGVILPLSAKFYQGAYLGGGTDYIEVPSFTSNPEFTEDKTISFWLDLDPIQVNTTGTTNTIILDGDGARRFKIGVHNNTALAADQGKLFIEIDDGATLVNLNSVSRIDDDEIHHIAVVLDSGIARIYIDGIEESNTANSTSGVYAGTYDFRIGDSVNNFSGTIDEVAYWRRTLHPNEVLQGYQRGANQVKYLVKSCVDSACICEAYNTGGSATDCDGDGQLNGVDVDDLFYATWKGVDNTSQTPFSELHNNTSIGATGQADGLVNLLKPNLDFSVFASAGLSLINNQYFQFRIEMTSSDRRNVCSGSVCSPDVSEVNIGSNNYFGGALEVETLSPYSYTSTIQDIDFDQIGGANCSFTYQLSNDAGVSWYYYNTGTGSWSLATTNTSNNSEIRSGIGSFHNVPGTKDLAVKIFMESLDTVSDCRLNQITVSFAN